MKIAAPQTRRSWIAGGAAVALLLVAVSWLMIHSKLASASDTQSQAENVEVGNSQLIAKSAKLAQLQRNIGASRAQLSAALDALPPSSALPEFTNQVTQTAAHNAVALSNIAIGTPSAVTAPAPAAPTTPGSATQTPASSGATASTGTPVPAAAPGQYSVGVTLTTVGTLPHQLAFIHALETGKRRALITSTLFGVAQGGTKGKVSVTTQLNIFTAPMSATQVAQLEKLLKPAR